MSPERLQADVDRYRQAAAANTPPPQIASDPLVGGLTPIEQLLRVLGLAANFSDEQDNAENTDEHSERDILAAEAADEFAAQDEQAAAEVNGVAGPDSAAQMAQQIPQLASGIAGAFGAAMQPVAQLPQQIAQGAQQAMQAGLGLLQTGGGSADLGATDLGDVGLADVGLGFDDAVGADDFGGDAGAGFGGGGGGMTGAGAGGAPTAALGPPIPPSAGTFASSVRAGHGPPASAGPASAPAGGMTGVPMIPPTALNSGAAGDPEAKTDTKRVSVPAVRNGGAVQGRITTPPTEPTPTATTTAPGKPVATRRLIVSRDAAPEDRAVQP